MRHITDSEGKIAWIYDEKTHPFGNENPVNLKKVEPAPVKVEEKPKVELFKKKK